MSIDIRWRKKYVAEENQQVSLQQVARNWENSFLFHSLPSLRVRVDVFVCMPYGWQVDGAKMKKKKYKFNRSQFVLIEFAAIQLLFTRTKKFPALVYDELG